MARATMQPLRRWSSSHSVSQTGSRFALVFDIDGVLLRGSRVIPGATDTMQRLQDRGIPFVFLTNGGGILEERKAEQLSQKLGITVDPKQVCLSHTPMKALVSDLAEKPILTVGKGNGPREIAEAYGFKRIVTMEEYAQQHPYLYPDLKVPGPAATETDPIAAVLSFNDPLYWGRELQILCDLARSNGYPDTHVDPQQVPFYFSGPDFEYVDQFVIPRFGSGSFRFCLEQLFHKVTNGRQLQSTVYGKPGAASYRFIEQILEPLGVSRYYMVGDNPLSDILGAQHAGPNWTSVLVKTGCWDGSKPAVQPNMVADDVKQGLDAILKAESGAAGMRATE